MAWLRSIGKKGDILDSFSLLITLVVLGIGFFVIAWIIPHITSGLNTAGLNGTAEGKSAIDHLESFGINGIQRGFFFLFIGLCLASLVSAFYLDSHPIWIFLYIIFLGLTVIIGAYLGNAYETLITNSAFAGFSQDYITIIMKNIIKIVIGVGALSIIIIFGKYAYGRGGGDRL